MGLQLTDDEIEELAERIRALVTEYAERDPAEKGKRVGFTVILHHLEPQGHGAQDETEQELNRILPDATSSDTDLLFEESDELIER